MTDTSSWTDWLDELRATLKDPQGPLDERADAAMTFRHANEGWVLAEPRGSMFADRPDGEPVPGIWRSREVIETLVAVCSDPNENVFVWTEAAEALEYIWADIGRPTQATLERLTPSARSQIIDHLEAAADPAAAQRRRDRNHWLSRLKEMPDSEVLLFYESAMANERQTRSTFARNDYRRMRVAAELQLRKRGLPSPSSRGS